MATIVTVSRKWDNPRIRVTVDQDGIELKMDMADFRKALKHEIGSVTWIFRKGTFDKVLDEAIDRVISGIKDESVKVV